VSQLSTPSTGSATASSQRPALAYVPEDFDHLLLALLSEPPPSKPDWREHGLCAQTDPDAFFPQKGGSSRDAKRVCDRCEVRDECLTYAIEHDERFGIWGGASERERRQIRREQQLEGPR
jgi:WhiB family redox-sensing transcriptional regulator